MKAASVCLTLIRRPFACDIAETKHSMQYELLSQLCERVAFLHTKKATVFDSV
jgi:hypothetical protein